MPRVLVIDDQGTVQLALALALRTEGWRVEGVITSHEGIQRARRSRPDAIVCDFSSPALNGLQVLAEVRCDPELKGIPVIVCTTRMPRALDRPASAFRPDAVLFKPFSDAELLAALRAGLKDREQPVLSE